MTTLRLFILSHDSARDGVARFAHAAPPGTVVRFTEPVRNAEINAALHAKLGEIAATRQWAGMHHDLDTWKRLLVAAWSRAAGESAVMLPALDGHGVDIVWRRTSQMTQAECRDLLAYIECWQAETEPEEQKA